VSLLLESAVGGGQLEGPQEVVGLLELGTAGGDLVDQVLDAGNAVLAKGALDDAVVGEGNPAAVDLSVATLVDELADGGAGGVAVGDEGLDPLDHVDSGLVELHEDSVVDLSQTQELEDLLGLGGQLVDTISIRTAHNAPTATPAAALGEASGYRSFYPRGPSEVCIPLRHAEKGSA
jgi:hypothetical protein